MKTLIAAVALMVGASGVYAGQVKWCVVNSVGNVMLCLPTMSSCQDAAGNLTNSSCVALQQ